MAKNTEPSLSKQRKLANLKPWKEGESGNLAGRPKGSLNLSTRVRNLLEGKEEMPDAIAETIRNAVATDKIALDATIIVGVLHALQGDESWAKLLWERGYGKVPQLDAAAPDAPAPPK